MLASVQSICFGGIIKIFILSTKISCSNNNCQNGTVIFFLGDTTTILLIFQKQNIWTSRMDWKLLLKLVLGTAAN